MDDDDDGHGWLARRYPKTMITCTDKALMTILRTPGLFFIDNYFRSFHYNWSVRHQDWGLILSHLAFLNGLILLVLPLSHLKCYYIHLICWCTLIHLSKAMFYLDHLPENLEFSSIKFENGTAVIFSHNNSSSNVFLLMLFHLTFDFTIVLLLQSSGTIVRLGLAGHAIIAAVSVLGLACSSNFIQVLDLLSYSIFYASFVGYFFRDTPVLLKDVKKLAINIIDIGKTEGISFLCLELFRQVFVPVHFLLFWALSFLARLYGQTFTGENQNDWSHVLLNIASSIFKSPVSLLATSVTVTHMSCFILTTIKLYLWGSGRPNNVQNNLNRDHNGWEEGVTTLLLTSITAYVDMTEGTRIAMAVIISFVVLSSLLQSILEISEPAIVSLNTNHHENRMHHIKVLLLCAFLFCFPPYVTYVYAQIFPVNFWIAVLFSSGLLISARVLDLVIIHCLFWWDSCRFEPWEYLDEVIYYVRSFTKILEFIISISVMVVGIWEAINKRSNIVNGSILVFHCYFNVYQRIKHGLESFFRRQAAAKIVAGLNVADSEQINQYDDICSICYVALKQTQIPSSSTMMVLTTRCHHLFHRQCIKKWLSIQNRCPICNAIITDSDSNR